MSQSTVHGWKDAVDEARKEAREERAENQQLVGRLKETRLALSNAEIQIEELRRANEKQATRIEDLEASRPSRLTWFLVGGSTVAATVATVVFFVAR